MGYDRGDSFSFDFEPNGIPFGSENGKENCHHNHIPFNARGIGNIVFSVNASPTRTSEDDGTLRHVRHFDMLILLLK